MLYKRAEVRSAVVPTTQKRALLVLSTDQNIFAMYFAVRSCLAAYRVREHGDVW